MAAEIPADPLAHLAATGADPRDAVPRVVVASDYLAALLPDPADGAATLTAQEWEQALLYAGLLPMVRDGGAQAAPALAGRLGALQQGLSDLRAAEARGGDRAALVPGAPLVHDALLAGLGAVALVGLVASAPWVAGGALVALLGALGARQIGAKLPGLSAHKSAALETARRRMTRAMSAFLRHTWVEPVGDGLLESAPSASELRQRMAALDQTLRRARARLAELDRIAAEIRAANVALGQPAADAETVRVQTQREALGAQIAAAEGLRGRFVEQLEACEAALERLRAVARRKLLSHRLSMAMERDPAGEQLAEAEVDVADLDQRAAALGREVGDAELRLAATLEVAALAPSFTGSQIASP